VSPAETSASDGNASNSSDCDASEAESDENEDLQDPEGSSVFKGTQLVGVVEPDVAGTSKSWQTKNINPGRDSLETGNVSTKAEVKMSVEKIAPTAGNEKQTIEADVVVISEGQKTGNAPLPRTGSKPPVRKVRHQ
jgi:hypothetical protein